MFRGSLSAYRLPLLLWTLFLLWSNSLEAQFLHTIEEIEQIIQSSTKKYTFFEQSEWKSTEFAECRNNNHLKKDEPKEYIDLAASIFNSSKSKSPKKKSKKLLKQIKKGKVKSREGLEGLNNALERDHDGSILDQLENVISGRNMQPQYERAANGAGILKHIFGGDLGKIIEMISKSNNMSPKASGTLLEKLAPIVLGTLGKQKRTSNMDMGGLGDLLGGVQTRQRQTQGRTGGLLKSILDRDGDGKVIDDVAGILGKFLKK